MPLAANFETLFLCAEPLIDADTGIMRAGLKLSKQEHFFFNLFRRAGGV